MSRSSWWGVIAGVALSLVFALPVKAECWVTAMAGPLFLPEDEFVNFCSNTGPDGTAEGVQYYSCANYCTTGLDEGICYGEWQYGCYEHGYACDTDCSGGGGGGGLECTTQNDCGPGTCCKGGTCKSNCGETNPMCNPGEIFEFYVPDWITCQSPGDCGIQADGTGGEAGEIWGDFCGPKADPTSKIECKRGRCVTPCAVTKPSGATVTTGASATVATLQWTPGTGGDTQRLYVDEDLPEVLNGCPTPGDCVVSVTGLSKLLNNYVVTGLSAGTTYYFRVVNYVSAACQDSVVANYTTPTQPDITGIVTVTDDGSCVAGDPATWNPTIEWGNDEAVYDPSDGSYTITTSMAGTYDLILYGVPDGYVCAPCAPCTVYVGAGPGGTNIAVIPGIDPDINGTNNYFYLTPARESWWQVEGAGVYAGSLVGGVNIRSLVPPAYDFIIPGPLGDVGLLMRAAGSYDVESAGGELSSEGWNAISRYRGKRLDYGYIASRQGVRASEVSDPVWGAGDAITKPLYIEKDFWYMEPPSGEAVISETWNVIGGESYVVFVNGDLRIEENVLVDTSSFVAFIVSGNIIVEPQVTDLQGIYITDGIFSTLSASPLDDVQLTVEGNIVAWTNVGLGRDIGTDNINTPAEKFVYRPDLLINMPLKMRTYALEWTEVAPGTFGE